MPHSGRRQADDVVLATLACGATAEAAARAANVSPSTVYRRLREPAFRAKLQTLRADMVQRAAAILTAASTGAGQTLVALMKPEEPSGIRLGAARTILEFSLKIREAAEVEARLAALEALLSQTK